MRSEHLFRTLDTVQIQVPFAKRHDLIDLPTRDIGSRSKMACCCLTKASTRENHFRKLLSRILVS